MVKKLKMKYIIILLVLIAAFTHALGTGNEIKATVNPSKGTVGDILTYKISMAIRGNENVTVKLPEKKILFQELKKVNRVSGSDSKKTEESPSDHVPLFIIHDAQRDETVSDGLKLLSITLKLSCYRPGTHKLPEVKITDSDGAATTYKVPSVTISELNKAGKLEDIEGPLSLSGNYTRIIILILLILSGLAAAYFLFRLTGKYRKKKKLMSSVTAAERFFMEIEKENLSELISKGHVNDYVFAISSIFRKYLSEDFKFDAPEMTTDEISKSMGQVIPGAIVSKSGNKMIDIMRFWDFSKFAEFNPSLEKLTENLRLTTELVREMEQAKESVGEMKEQSGQGRSDAGN